MIWTVLFCVGFLVGIICILRRPVFYAVYAVFSALAIYFITRYFMKDDLASGAVESIEAGHYLFYAVCFIVWDNIANLAFPQLSVLGSLDEVAKSWEEDEYNA